jgi:S-adenosylmethionine:tRNA ribosyltransferase-isomerase
VKPADFDYELPADRIAQTPVEPRDVARLLVHDVARDRTDHRLVRDLVRILRAGDLLVVNDTRVRPARLCGRRATGGAVERRVVGPVGTPPDGEPLWRALVNPARRLHAGERLELEEGALEALAVERTVAADGRRSGEWSFVLRDPRAPRTPLAELLERCGRMPLPPYIRRGRGADPLRDLDRERYQTVFARAPGAIAAPTAGLHFTPELLAALEARGVERATVTLHVGVGTFQPITADEIETHRMHAEAYALAPAAAEAVRRARERGGRVVAVGTTVARVL